MRIAVIGSRKIEDYEWFSALLNKVVGGVEGSKSFVSGGSEGIDSMVHKFSKENGLDSFMYKPHFLLDKKATYSPRDFFTRYRQIVDNADQVVVIVKDGEEEADLNFAKEYAEKRERPLFVVTYK